MHPYYKMIVMHPYYKMICYAPLLQNDSYARPVVMKSKISFERK